MDAQKRRDANTDLLALRNELQSLFHRCNRSVSWIFLNLFFMFQVLVIGGGTDVTQPLCLLRACCFSGVAEFVRAAGDVGELLSQVQLADCAKGRGRPGAAAQTVPGAGWMLKKRVRYDGAQEMNLLQFFPDCVYPRISILPPAVHAVYQM